MKPVYEIKFLSSQDFDNLPETETNGSDISDSLGFYNPFTNRVFIRHTAIPELDKYLLEHEFEHLLEKEATDEDENGIRHKKKRGFGRFLQVFFNPLNVPGMGPLTTDNKGFLHTAQKNQQPDYMSPEDTAAQGKQQSQLASFGGLGMGLPGGDVNTPTTGSSFNPLAGQQSSQSGLNQGLNSQTINPLDPYSQFGRPAGRLSF